VDNFEDVWLYKNKFDFIHSRELEGCIADEEKLFKQAFEHLKPGGYFEVCGAYAYFLSDDDTHKRAESSAIYLEHARAAGEKFGKSFEGVKTWKEKMNAVGFKNVTESVVKVRIP
jgi:predicted methyltransferase